MLALLTRWKARLNETKKKEGCVLRPKGFRPTYELGKVFGPSVNGDDF
jgi:hypothetical protein